MKSTPALLAAVLATMALGANAQTQAAGLWEHTFKQVDGRPQHMAIDMTGKWLGADCGDIKPLGALPAK